MEIEGTQVDGFVVHPGDKLIIQAEPSQSMEQIARLRAQLEANLSGIEYVVIATRQILVVRGTAGAAS